MRTKPGKALAVFATIVVSLTWVGSAPAVAAGPTTSVVTAGQIAPHGPWALEPTSNTGTYSFVTGPASPPGGVGSLAMSVADGQHEWLNNYSYGACATGPSCNNSVVNWTLVASLDTLGYSTYRSSGSTYPTFNIEVDPVGDGSGYATFVFVPNSGSIVNNTWQTWNGLNPSDGAWLSTRQLSTGPFTCAPQSCSASWSQVQVGYPAARVKYGLGPNVGSGGTFVGNIDDFTVGVSGSTTIYDFEPAPSAPRSVASVPGNGSAIVSWRAPTSNGGSAITGYLVTPYLGSVARPVRTFNSTKTTATVTGLQNGKVYRFEVAARNAIGTGAWSPKSGPVTVGAPGKPGNVTAKAVSGSLRVTFTKPASNGAAIKSYTATCASSNGGTTKSKTRPGSPVSVTGVTHGRTYRCRVVATNSRGTGPRSLPSGAVVA
jgi:hypothetical protein